MLRMSGSPYERLKQSLSGSGSGQPLLVPLAVAVSRRERGSGGRGASALFKSGWGMAVGRISDETLVVRECRCCAGTGSRRLLRDLLADLVVFQETASG